MFPYIEIRFKDKLNAIDDLTLQKKVSASIEENGGLDKLPTDENGNKIVEITIEGEKTPVVIGSNEGLEKIGKEVKDAIKKKLETIDDFMKTPDFQKLLDNAWSKYKGKLPKDKWIERYKTLYKNRSIGKLTEDKFKELMNGEPKIFKFQGETRKVDNVLDTTAREIKSGKLKNSEFIENQLRKDIMMLLDEDIPIKKIEWHLFEGADNKMIEKLKLIQNTYGKEKFDFIIY